MVKQIGFMSIDGAVAYLDGQGFQQNGDGAWQRSEDGATAEIELVSLVKVCIITPAKTP
jgi:hypothetical protein